MDHKQPNLITPPDSPEPVPQISVTEHSQLPVQPAANNIIVGGYNEDLRKAQASENSARRWLPRVIIVVSSVVVLGVGVGTILYAFHINRTVQTATPAPVTAAKKVDTSANALSTPVETIGVPYQAFNYELFGTAASRVSEVNGRSVVIDTDKDTGAKYVFSIYKSDRPIADCSIEHKYTVIQKVPMEGKSYSLCQQKNVYAYTFTRNTEWYVAAVVSDDPNKLVSADKAAKIMASIRIKDKQKIATPTSISVEVAVQNAATDYIFRRYGSLELNTNRPPTDGYSFTINTMNGNNARGIITHPDGHTTTTYLHKTNTTWAVIWDGRPVVSKEIGAKNELPADWISTSY